MKISSFFRRLVAGDQGVAWAFIALVALFLTQPSGQPVSIFNQPIPLPAELESAAPDLGAPAHPPAAH